MTRHAAAMRYPFRLFLGLTTLVAIASAADTALPSDWIDPQTGFVWRSRQTIHPRGDTLETEIFRPPG